VNDESDEEKQIIIFFNNSTSIGLMFWSAQFLHNNPPDLGSNVYMLSDEEQEAHLVAVSLMFSDIK